MLHSVKLLYTSEYPFKDDSRSVAPNIKDGSEQIYSTWKCQEHCALLPGNTHLRSLDLSWGERPYSSRRFSTNINDEWTACHSKAPAVTLMTHNYIWPSSQVTSLETQLNSKPVTLKLVGEQINTFPQTFSFCCCCCAHGMKLPGRWLSPNLRFNR